MISPHDIVGTRTADAPPQYPCDGCSDAFLSMCGAGWTLATLTLHCPDCGPSVRYLHLCPGCSRDPMGVVERVLDPSHWPAAEPARLQLVPDLDEPVEPVALGGPL